MNREIVTKVAGAFLRMAGFREIVHSYAEISGLPVQAATRILREVVSEASLDDSWVVGLRSYKANRVSPRTVRVRLVYDMGMLRQAYSSEQAMYNLNFREDLEDSQYQAMDQAFEKGGGGELLFTEKLFDGFNLSYVSDILDSRPVREGIENTMEAEYPLPVRDFKLVKVRLKGANPSHKGLVGRVDLVLDLMF